MQLSLLEIQGKNPVLQRPLLLQSFISSLDVDVPDGIHPDMLLGLDRAALIWAFAHILPLKILPAEAATVIIQTFKQSLLKIGTEYAKALTEGETNIAVLPLYVLAIADRRIVTLTGAEGCFDLKICRRMPVTPLTFEGVSYNLGIPVRLEWDRLHMERANAKQRAEGSLPDSRYAGVRPLGHSRGSPGQGDAAMGPTDGQAGAI